MRKIELRPSPKIGRSPVERIANLQQVTPNLYGHKWRVFRISFLKEHPLCVFCQEKGLSVAATVVDHIEPHNGNPSVFWKPGNHQALCKHCHDSVKQKVEWQERGFRI